MKKSLLGSGKLSNLHRVATGFLGLDGLSATLPARRAARAGAFSSAIALLIVASWMAVVSSLLSVFFVSFAFLGVLVLVISIKKNLTLARANLIALLGHLVALVSFYVFYTRMVNVTYVTDAIVGTYMGVLKVLEGQNPYAFSIKPFLDQLGLPPSLYTPRVDGSFEFHLNYPALNFLSLTPFYLAGLRDLRDGVFVFHMVSMVVLFGVVPSRMKALSLAPFAVGFPLAISYSWTDSVWALLILLTAVLWRRNKGLSLASFGLGVATKQIVLVAAPFLLIRLWKDSEASKLKSLVKGSGLMFAAFLAPNLPFIIASPSSWWAATVVPYLPGGTPLMLGGVGLAEILPDLGFALSPVFYTLVTGIVALVCLVAFVLRYDRLNHFMWAMPIFILFCYHRSLPNYLVFWVIPFIFEWFRYGHPSLSYLGSIVHPFWRRASWGLSGLLRGRVGPTILIVLVLVGVLAGASEAYVTQVSGPRVEVKLDGMADPESLGVATNLAVTVTNHGSQAISPIFFVKWFFLWNLWKANQTQVLPVGASASYLLTATDALGGVPRGYSFHVAVFDSVTGQFVAQSQSNSVEIARPPIANPHFAWWTLDEGSGKQAPYGWRLSLKNLDSTVGGISVLNKTESRGVQLRLNSTVNLNTSGELELSQRLFFNETQLSIRVYAPQWNVPFNRPVLGVRMTDGSHVLYFVLSGEANTVKVTRYSENTTVTMPIGYSSWNQASLDTQSVWKSQGWNTPTSLDLSLFLRSNQGGVFVAGIQQVNLGV